MRQHRNGPCTSRRWRAARSTARSAPPEASRFLLPGSALPRLALARLAPLALLYSAPLDAARSKVPRWAARLMLGTLAACLRFRRQLGRCRRSALLNVGPTLAAGSPRVAGRVPLSRDRFVPPVFSSLLGGAREEEEIAD
ncbi:MAG: hypothetical protein H3C50_09920 [Kiritimatiellae bacterium]|nr:hypothetical protein [Kiritimatiellia bacterium]